MLRDHVAVFELGGHARNLRETDGRLGRKVRFGTYATFVVTIARETKPRKWYF